MVGYQISGTNEKAKNKKLGTVSQYDR